MREEPRLTLADTTIMSHTLKGIGTKDLVCYTRYSFSGNKNQGLETEKWLRSRQHQNSNQYTGDRRPQVSFPVQVKKFFKNNP